MKFLLILFLTMFVVLLLFAKVTIRDRETHNIFERIIPCLIISATMTLFFGLPLLGIAFLIIK